MATYKVLQDIEAEDKLIGPFGIRQFIYVLIVVASVFIGFRLAMVAWYLVLPLLPHTLFFALLALPFGGEQPTETWLLAKIRFAIKPRTRIWSQSGILNLVTVTAPKKIEQQLTKNLSSHEVKSRLSALANTIDSRGWAVKNVDVNLFSQPAFAQSQGSSDRLVAYGNTVTEVPAFNITASDDMLDERNNPRAQNLDRLITSTSKNRREKLVSQMKHPTTPSTEPAQQSTNWFQRPNVSPPAQPAPSNVVLPDPNAPTEQKGLPLRPLYSPPTEPLTEDELLEKIHNDQAHAPKHKSGLHVVKTLDDQAKEAQTRQTQSATNDPPPTDDPATQQPGDPSVTPTIDPDILKLANNDDLNVATIARQANKKKVNEDESSDGEVVINLH